METSTETAADLFGGPIYAYPRAQALEDGVLVDVSEAQEAGIVWPVAMTRAVWADCVEWDEATDKRKGYTGQSESGRLWDVVWMLGLALRGAARRGLDPAAGPLAFQLYRTPAEGRGIKPRLVLLKFVVGPDDDGRPCITVMLPTED